MKKIALVVLCMVLSLTVSAQKGDLKSGDWKAISGITTFDLEFEYGNVTVPDFDTEEDYIKQKMKEKNEDKPGEGEVWRKRYFADREEHFEPKFIESFNKRGDWKTGKDLDDAEHVIKVDVTMLSHGWNVGVMRKAARLDAVISVYKRGEDKPLLSAKYENVKGADAMGFDYGIHSRVAEGFAKLAKSFLADVKKKG